MYNGYTITQLRTLIIPNKRAALIELNGGDTVADDPITTYCDDGQMESQTQIFRDVETLKEVSRKTIAWTYYDTGEVDTITISETGKPDKKIKHYTDGRQPVTEK